MPDERRTIPIADLRPAPFNPKQPIHGEYRRGLETSLSHFGVRDDLKVWPCPGEPGAYIVLDGNQRLDVLRESGLESVECRILADLDEHDAKLFTASFDRNHAAYSESKLAALADELKSKGAELVARLLRPDASLIPPPPRDEPGAIREAKEQLEAGSVPFMVTLSREGYTLAKGYLLKSRSRLKQEERLLTLLACLSERQVDDLVVDLAIHLGAELAK